MDNNELIAKLAQDVKPVKLAPHPFMLSGIWLFASAVYIIIALIAFGTRSDLAIKWHAPLFTLEIALLVLTIISCAFCSALLAFPDQYQKRNAIVIPITMAGLLVAVLLSAWYQMPDAPAPEHGMTCTLHITMMSLMPAIVLFYGIGRLASTHAAKAGLMALLTAFSTGALIARLSEKTDSIHHIVEWHYVPMLAVAFIGAFLGKLLLRW